MITGITPSWKQGFARSAEESEYPNRRDGLQLLCAPSLGPTGLVAKDASGYGLDGDLTAMDPATDWVLGDPRMGGYALNFDGVDGYVAINDPVGRLKNTVGLINELSLAIWFNSSGGANQESLVEWDSGSSGDYAIRIKDGGTESLRGFYIKLITAGSSATARVGGQRDFANQWNYVVLTYSPGVASVYWQGQLIGTDTSSWSGALSHATFGEQQLTIGGSPSRSEFVPTKVSQVQVANRAYTPNEIKLLYEQPNALLQPRDGGLHVTATITVNYTRAQSAALGTDETDLGTAYSASDYTDVDTDNAVRVGQIASDANFAVHLFKDFVGSETSATLTCNVQSDLAPSSRTVFLQVYNYNSTTWENVDSENIAAADTDFDLTGNIADLTNYKSAEFIACRVYQANA